MKHIEKMMAARIRGRGRGWCFTPADFADLGGDGAVWTALHRQARRKAIRRLAQGLYDFPRIHPRLGQMAPDPDAIARALSRSRAIRMQPSGAFAANLLGLSEQVPARIVYLTDGISRRVKIGGREIILKRATPRTMATAGRTSGIVIQALRFVGKDRLTSRHVGILRKKLDTKDKQCLTKDRIRAPAWMRPYLLEICRRTPPNA
ncbi:MAG: hypothetical protein A3G34_04900 [Candidatus Lindowbacteria bacterium RIFCSPLOWO2_12_FULL_62_27]|nr:MAG: hypothetical protein A3G34_04900 [Candidatus Lindowbacteria bacterium RIFCSPLOWO2_12_FULL_62_27]OGH62091.1 MAG: hypothetical protein A3I06_02445 [Candidatus Lindowbacteria bacterium RIFCSPLOWO2_02_FULL_62_12]